MMAPELETIPDVRERLLSLLQGVKAHGDYFMALCPSHDDSKPSLSIREHEDGCSVKCHTGCETDEVLGAIGLTKSDLYPRKPKATLEVSKSSTTPTYYYYQDVAGNPLFRVRRRADKTFPQERYVNGQYLSGLGGLEPVPYHLPELMARRGEPVFIVEGEKDADRLLDLGLLATTSPMGAGKWREEYADYLRDFETIYVIPDNDAQGEKHARDVADTLPQAKIVRLPGVPLKGDVSDWLDAGGTSVGLLKLAENSDFLVFSPYSTENRKPENSGPVSLGSLEKPGAREWLVNGLIPMKYPTTLYGTGGVSKSFLALSLGMAIAAEEPEWLGFKITGGPVLYLDFELEVEEQTRRAYEVAVGMGYERPPGQLFYQSAGGMKMMQAFHTSLQWCKETNTKLMIVDSTGLALEGDSESAKDVIAFFREVVGAFMQAGVCVLLIDHQSKMQSGDNYQKKSAFGSGYKEYLARSAVQVELVNRHKGEIMVRFRQKKTNFGSLVDPFEVKVSFGDDRVSVERVNLDDGDLASEESLGAEERVIRAVRHLEAATPVEAAELTGLALATVRKQFSLLKKRELLMENGQVRDGARVCIELRDADFLFSTDKGEKTRKPVSAPVTYLPSDNSENSENLENELSF